MNLNKVFLLGRAVDKPELRTTPSGQSVSTFSLATNIPYTDKKGNKQEETEYHNVVAWGKLAEVIAKYIDKGDLVFVEGNIKLREWSFHEERRKDKEIIAEKIQFHKNSPNPLLTER